jgi:hypothetical protein
MSLRPAGSLPRATCQIGPHCGGQGVKALRPYYLCAHCHISQFPVNVAVDIDNTEFSPACVLWSLWWPRSRLWIMAASR